MKEGLQDDFLNKWQKYFDEKAELPIAFWFSEDRIQKEEIVSKSWNCLIGLLHKIRHGKSASFSVYSIGCGGGKCYCGFADRPEGLNVFLSTGKERYLKNPEIAQKAIDAFPVFKAPAKYICFKRWDRLTEEDNPDVVIFFATPDVLSGLFTLANYDQEGPFVNIAPFSAGCGSIISYPYQESKKDKQKTILGMFDVSARPYVPENSLSFAVPMKKFESMIDNMDESFLTTDDWKKVQKRISK
ncbi:DUF169 domain-containing protein [Ancylomarina longa]|uniref:DUF169 domain-containing protein n=1 Tax=Ancylomarina longa TaxID=2487017 RepID=A0A434AV45_9BACT|nr:DUF169 domain-containing protein [Ancylomarina longa]RUT78347.1 hypothetical protein DLK05_08455 [Ancylomarina longa]